MRRSAQAVLGLALLATTVFAQADDKVIIRYVPGQPLPDRSSEVIEVRVERMRAPPMAVDQGVDRFFSLVQATLSEHRIVRDWQLVIPDAPYIEIAIDLNGRRTRLASAHVPIERSEKSVVTERGSEPLGQRTRDALLAQQSDEYRRYRLAFDRLLELTLERLRARVSP